MGCAGLIRRLPRSIAFGRLSHDGIWVVLSRTGGRAERQASFNTDCTERRLSHRFAQKTLNISRTTQNIIHGDVNIFCANLWLNLLSVQSVLKFACLVFCCPHSGRTIGVLSVPTRLKCDCPAIALDGSPALLEGRGVRGSRIRTAQTSADGIPDCVVAA